MVYFSYVHSVLFYGIKFWGNSHLYIINNVFKFQKRIISIISNSGSRDPCLTQWFSANGLVLNMGKTNIMKFTRNTSQNETFQIIYHNKILTGTNNTKFLGLELYKNVNWKKHI